MVVPVAGSLPGIARPAGYPRPVPCYVPACSISTNRRPSALVGYNVRRSLPSIALVSRCLRSIRIAPPTCATQQSQAVPSGGQQHQVVVQGSSYEEVIAQLSERVLSSLQQQPAGRKLIIGIAGAPGSGKSTLAASVMQHINRTASQDLAVLLPMDGFHYYRRELDQMPDAQAAHARRGAHWTFNAKRFVECVRRVRTEGAASAPAFEHGVGDPVEDAIQITQQHRVVLVEGNYVLLDIEPWGVLKKELLDDTWFVDVDLSIAMERVFKRQTGNGLSEEVSRGRLSNNDQPNGEYIISHSRHQAAVLVPSNIPWASARS